LKKKKRLKKKKKKKRKSKYLVILKLDIYSRAIGSYDPIAFTFYDYLKKTLPFLLQVFLFALILIVSKTTTKQNGAKMTKETYEAKVTKLQDKMRAFEIGQRDGAENWTPSFNPNADEDLQQAYLDGWNIGQEYYNHEDPNDGYHPEA
jgi:hypothetical protein